MTHIEADAIVAAMKSSAPIPDSVIVALSCGVSDYDCEEWDAVIGHAIIARLRRPHQDVPE